MKNNLSRLYGDNYYIIKRDADSCYRTENNSWTTCVRHAKKYYCLAIPLNELIGLMREDNKNPRIVLVELSLVEVSIEVQKIERIRN